jgi:hypothetical protein
MCGVCNMSRRKGNSIQKFAGKRKGKRPLGRYGGRWEDKSKS